MKKRCGVVIVSAVLSFLYFAPTSAVTYSTEEDVKFTFNPQIDVNIDSADIEILDLAPGTRKDSNIVSITVGTNSIAGYNISATVGNTTYNNTNMNHITTNDVFTSLSTDADVATITTANTWGYSISEDGTSWSNFSGLPVYTETAKQILNTEAPSVDNTRFKINAYASDSQTAGDYRNVINFIVVANVPPKTIDDVIEITDPAPPIDPQTKLHTMQSMTEDICDAVEAIDEQTRLTDIRDHKTYWVAKLKDGRCWMTQNLDFDLDSTKTYTNADTDLGWDGTKYTTASWQPAHSTVSSENIRQDGYVEDWESMSSEPVSFDPGDWYWYTNGGWYSLETNNYLAGDVGNPEKFSTTAFSENGAHGHLGNYYNFPAATADNNYSSSYGAQANSVCPKNWGLPPVTAAGMSMNNLANYYGNTTNDDRYLASAPTYLVRGGQMSAQYLSAENKIVGVLSNSGDSGFYWYNVRNAMNNSANGISMMGSSSYMGHSIRCTVRTATRVTLIYNANDGTGSMPRQEVRINRSIQLISNQFTREGYKFVGWNTNVDGLGVGYGDGDTYTANVGGSTTSVTLYAQWEEDPGSQGGGGYQGRTLARAYEEAYLYNHGDYEGHRGMYVPERDAQGNYTGNYFEATSPSDYDGIPARDLRFAMQDADLEVDGQKVCDRANVAGSEVHLLDLRDNKSYWAVVTKNGKCWMTQNLDLNLNTNKTLTPADTDITANWTPPQNTISYTSGTISGWPDNSLGDYGGPAMSVDVGNWYFAGFNYNDRCTNGCDYVNGTTDGVFSQTPYDLNGEHGHVGNYYNWHAAHATSEPYIQTFTPAETSICPKGWFLPYFSGSSNPEDGDDFAQLMNTYSSYDMNSDANLVPGPFYMVHAGLITVGRLSDAGVNGQYHTRERENHYWGYSGYGFASSNNGIDYIASIQRKSAATIRCLMR